MKRKIIYILSILASWGIILFIFLAFFQKQHNESSNNLDINSSFIQDLYKMIVPNKDAYILNQLYSNNELTNEYKLNIGILNFIDNNPQFNENHIPSEKVLESLKEVLGDDTDVEHQTLMFMINGHCGYEYNDVTHQYESFDGCGGIPSEYFYRKLLKAEEIEDKVILTEQSFYSYVSRNENANNIYVYNNCKQEKMLDYIENNDGSFYEINENDYIDKGSIFQYIFSKENGKYRFKEFRKI